MRYNLRFEPQNKGDQEVKKSSKKRRQTVKREIIEHSHMHRFSARLLYKSREEQHVVSSRLRLKTQHSPQSAAAKRERESQRLAIITKQHYFI